LVGRENIARARQKGAVFIVHHGGEHLGCGGGNALDPERIRETRAAVEKFLTGSVGLNANAARTVMDHMEENMSLSGNPKEHVQRIVDIHKRLGVNDVLVLTHDISTGDLELGHVTGSWNYDRYNNAVHVGCSDARALNKPLSQGQLMEVLGNKSINHGAVPDEAQNPERVILEKGPTVKERSNTLYTVTGLGDDEISELLGKAQRGEELTVEDKHNLASLALSVYYGQVEHNGHRWPGGEEAVEKLKGLLG